MEKQEFTQIKYHILFHHIVTFIFINIKLYSILFYSKHKIIFYLIIVVWSLLNVRNIFGPSCRCSLDILSA